LVVAACSYSPGLGKAVAVANQDQKPAPLRQQSGVGRVREPSSRKLTRVDDKSLAHTGLGTNEHRWHGKVLLVHEFGQAQAMNVLLLICTNNPNGKFCCPPWDDILWVANINQAPPRPPPNHPGAALGWKSSYPNQR
ncbi:hypothetical protein KCU88_g295, partial [Aureobasidium melanogenum]